MTGHFFATSSPIEVVKELKRHQAYAILDALESCLGLREPVTIEKLADGRWTATRGGRSHLGDSPADVFGQLCQTLIAERGE